MAETRRCNGILTSSTPLCNRNSPRALVDTMRSTQRIVYVLRSSHRHLSAQPVVISGSLCIPACSRGPQGRLWCASIQRAAIPHALIPDIRVGQSLGNTIRDISAVGRPWKAPRVDAAADTSPAASSASADYSADRPPIDAAPPIDAFKAKRKPRSHVVAVGPSSLDLDSGAPSPEIATVWTSVREWVVFSDLHVSAKTVGVALEVLRTVHAEAVRRDAGILFLGAQWNLGVVG